MLREGRTRPTRGRRWPPGSSHQPVPGRGELRDPDEHLSENEHRTAAWLAELGHVVEAVQRGPRRTPDILVDGVPVEMKHPTGRKGRPGPTSQTIMNRLRESGGAQSVDVLVDVRGRRIQESEVRRTFLRAFSAFRWLRSLRIVGDDLDVLDVVER